MAALGFLSRRSTGRMHSVLLPSRLAAAFTSFARPASSSLSSSPSSSSCSSGRSCRFPASPFGWFGGASSVSSRLGHLRPAGTRGIIQYTPGYNNNTQSAGQRHTVTLLRGNGIGPEVVQSVVHVFTAMKAPIDWETFDLPDPIKEPDRKDRISPELKKSLARNGFCIKGPFYTPMGRGFDSPDVQLAKEFGMFAHVVPIKNSPNVPTRHQKIDMIIIRENTEGEYSGLEHEVNSGIVQSLKVITRQASRNIAEYAFKYALENGRRKVTAVHKANIMKMADGLFLECCREVAKTYTGRIAYDEVIIDNCCMQLVTRPQQFDVIVTGNLYGNIISNAASGLAGGVGLIPGFNCGRNVRIYEQGCRHIGLDIAGQNLANPIASMRAGGMMLRDMGLVPYAEALEHAIEKTLWQGNKDVLTSDIDGCKGTTSSLTSAVINNLIPVRLA